MRRSEVIPEVIPNELNELLALLPPNEHIKLLL
jgi:hypothetical protein